MLQLGGRLRRADRFPSSTSLPRIPEMGRSGTASGSVRLTGGRLRGQLVRVPSSSAVRPTSSRVREAAFSMLGQNLHGVSVLDLFGGSGLLTFEAASRGAAPLTVVERDRRVAQELAESARALGLSLDLRVSDAKRVTAGCWDLVLLDPPYADNSLTWLHLAAPRASWRLLIEHPADRRLPASVDGSLVQLRSRTYGRSALTLYGRERPDAGVAEDEPVAEDLGVVEGKGEPINGAVGAQDLPKAVDADEP